MSEAAPEPALADTEQDALARLRYGWGDAYRIDQLEADRLAAELGCEITLNPRFAGLLEARDPAPGVWLLSGTADGPGR